MNTRTPVRHPRICIQVTGYEALRSGLDARLQEYNETSPEMDLVLFQQVSFLFYTSFAGCLVVHLRP